MTRAGVFSNIPLRLCLVVIILRTDRLDAPNASKHGGSYRGGAGADRGEGRRQRHVRGESSSDFSALASFMSTDRIVV
jgi:hypothetical protein